MLVLTGVAIAGLILLAIGFAARTSGPVRVTIDGRDVRVPYGTTVAALQRDNALAARRGRLLAVNGSVLATEGGAPPRVLRNGRPALEPQVVFEGDVIQATNGPDSTEATVTIREPVPVATKMTGDGPVMRLADPGSVGVSERVVGSVSGVVVSESPVVKMREMVVVRTHPTPSEKLVALTFDDGPWPGQTDKVVKILQHEGVRATFFMLGVRVKAHPELARMVADAGNQVGDHTLGHRDLTKSKDKEIRRQIIGGAKAIADAIGQTPTWFRPPYGAINDKVWRQVRSLKFRVALWDIDTRDWTRPGVKKIVRRAATKRLRKGDIILMHDGGPDRSQSIRALPTIIRKLKKRGFVFVTLEELLDAR